MRLSGATVMETAAQCELGRSAVIRAAQAYAQGGWKAASGLCWRTAKGSGRLLSQRRTEVQRLIQDRTPDQLKMSYALWTRQAVGE